MLPSPTDVTIELYRSAVRVFSEMWDGTPIRQLGVHTSRLTHEEAYQFNLFDRETRPPDVCGTVPLTPSAAGWAKTYFRACFLTGPTKNMVAVLIGHAGQALQKAYRIFFPMKRIRYSLYSLESQSGSGS